MKKKKRKFSTLELFKEVKNNTSLSTEDLIRKEEKILHSKLRKI